jgi:hypothetical protein
MPGRKIQDETELIRWIEEGKTYAWMVEEYKRKYNIEMVPSSFSNFRRRRGLERRSVRNDDLIPWAVDVKHRWKNHIVMLRAEARRREGKPLNAQAARALVSWLASMKEQDLVVHYDPNTEEGFFYVPRRKDVDFDLIRVPEKKTTQRHRLD